MAIDYQALKNELVGDAENIGYKVHIDNQDSKSLAALLNNSTVRTSKESIVAKEDFLLAILPAVLVLPEKDEASQKKWDRILGLLQSVNQVRIGNALIKTVIAEAVKDGLLTEEQVGKIGEKKISRAAELGLGQVDYWDVERALQMK